MTMGTQVDMVQVQPVGLKEAIAVFAIFAISFPIAAGAHPVEETDWHQESNVVFMDHLGYSPTDFGEEIFVSPTVNVVFDGLGFNVEPLDWIEADFVFGCIEPDGTLRSLFVHQAIRVTRNDLDFNLGFYGERAVMEGCDAQNDDPTEYAGYVESQPLRAGAGSEVFSATDVGAANSIILIDTDLLINFDAPTGGCLYDRFADVPCDTVFAADIDWLSQSDITRGCNPPAYDRFCPNDPVTRGQMAAFLNRALELESAPDPFTDTSGSVFSGDIGALAASGITRGCNPPENTRFCPEEVVTRGQMAAFLVRALGYSDDGGGDLFTDDDESVFESDIDRLGTEGVTRGCNPPDNDRFCPEDPVTRGQMAAFLRRALTE